MGSFAFRRRSLLCSAAGLTLGGAHLARAGDGSIKAAPAGGDPGASYDVAGDIVNLENAYYGIMARPVLEDYKRNLDYLNRHNSHFLRTRFDRGIMPEIRAQLAAYAGVAPGEIALTRSAVESLQNLIVNYRLLKAGETVMIGNLDYGTVMDAMRDLARRRGAEVASVLVPEPATRQNVIDAYRAALDEHPRTRLLLLTHVSHRTGLVLPVAEIARIARARNVDVVVDVAQSFGQLDFRIADLGADFVGANLHKWIGAPLGLGFLYIREGRLQDIDIDCGNSEHPATDIRARVNAGTLNVAAVMTIPAALAFHGRIPLSARAAHLRGLRDYWATRVRSIPNVQVLTPDDAGMTGAVTSFRLAGKTSMEANVALARTLADKYGIFTVAREGAAGGSCIRVTPSYFTTTAQLDRLVAAIRTLAV
jgi:isopenicillin-N epimerase